MKKIVLTFVAMTMAGCSSAPPTIQQGPNAEVSYDGLHAIDNSIFKAAWADPDIDFSRYDKIMAGGAFFEYRAVKKTSGTYRARASDTEFYIDEKAREKLKELTSEIFNEELAKSSRFSVTDASGPDVLIIRGGLHDIVSQVPPDIIGRGDIYLSSVGEITLILEVVDSMSGEVIFRAVERRAAERGGGMAMRSNSVNTRSEVRRLIRRWATTLRDGLDSIPAE
ncbi:MAG: DUF3313 family protein [Proteobacteria bacterium]|nr:DUF3313 family protein [Pseudomonadota bacterium]MCH8101309.1 DUF3313 family protein [Pseudomonadota bacterium]